MKLITVCAVGAFTTGSLTAQGIFNVSPNDGVTNDIPLEISGTLNYGWDDNVTPAVKANRGDSSMYTSFNLGANYLNLDAQTRVDFNFKLGVLYYLDDIENSNANSTYSDSRMILNVAHNVSERLRLTTKNYAFYGLEPDYAYGAVSDRSNDEYLLLSTDNAVGYKWTERLGTITGFNYSQLGYDDRSNSDRKNLGLYNQFRYVLSQQAVSTLDYRYRMTDVEAGLDSDNHKVLVGLDYRISEAATLVAKAGVQYRKVDTRDATTDPTFEIGYMQRMNQMFRVRANLVYDTNDYGTTFGTRTFDDNQTFRLNLAGDYQLSKQLYVTCGINYVANQYSAVGVSDDDVDVFNISIGATYKMMANLSANITYNHTKSSDVGDTLNRDYDRNRIQAGLTYTF